VQAFFLACTIVWAIDTLLQFIVMVNKGGHQQQQQQPQPQQ